jgi:hypothetical protein
MRDDNFDRILSEEQEIIPSSGFVGSVMEAVRRAAATPPPIAFPWKRALPGVAVALLAVASVFVAGIALFTRGAAAQPLPVVVPSSFALILEGAKTVRAGWIALALILSLASVKLSIRLAAWRT